MRPQDRVNAILDSNLEPSERLILVALARRMQDDNMEAGVWVGPATIERWTGLSRSVVQGAVARLTTAGVLYRWQEQGNVAKSTRVVWDALAAAPKAVTARGGVRSPGTLRPDTQDYTPLPDNRTPPTRTPDTPLPDNRTRSGESSGDRSGEVSGNLSGAVSAPTPETAHPIPATISPPSKRPRRGAVPVTPDMAEIYEIHRRRHPTAKITPTPDNAAALVAIVAECTPEEAGLYFAWVAESDDAYARQIRGAAQWPGGETTRRDDLVGLSRHIPPRLAAAQAWDARGRSAVIEVVPVRTPGHRNGRINTMDMFESDEAFYAAQTQLMDAK